jgi:hypothetical protein
MGIDISFLNDRPSMDDSGWPELPGQLVYHLDAVVKLYERIHAGERLDLLEELLGCVDWREMFGSEGTGFLSQHQLQQLHDYYHQKFSGLERFYLAEQLSAELMTAMMVSGEQEFSEELKSLGRDNPALWSEIRTFFTRKEFATSIALLADEPSAG